jgi:hypothetical protein
VEVGWISNQVVLISMVGARRCLRSVVCIHQVIDLTGSVEAY